MARERETGFRSEGPCLDSQISHCSVTLNVPCLIIRNNNGHIQRHGVLAFAAALAHDKYSVPTIFSSPPLRSREVAVVFLVKRVASTRWSDNRCSFEPFEAELDTRIFRSLLTSGENENSSFLSSNSELLTFYSTARIRLV